MKRFSLFLLLFSIAPTLVTAQEKPIFLNSRLLHPETLESLSNKSYNEVIIKENNLILAKSQGQWSFLNWRGEEITDRKLSWYPIFHDGIAIKAMGGLSAEHFGIDEKGTTVFSLNCKNLQPFVHGVAALTNRDYKIGFINKKGKEVITPSFDAFKQTVLVNGQVYHSVKKGNGWGLINAKGKAVLPFKYQQVTYLKDDVFLLRVTDKANPTSSGSFGATINNYDYGLWSISKGTIAKPTIDFIKTSEEFVQRGLLVGRVKKTEGLGLIDFSGNTVLPPLFNDLELVGDNLLSVSELKSEKTVPNKALSDLQGNLKTQYLFDYVGPLANGLIPVCVSQGGRRGCGYVDANAQLKIPLNFQSVGAFNASGQAVVGYEKQNGRAKVMHKGIINKANEPVLPLIFGQISRVSDKYFKVNAPNNVYEHLLHAATGELTDTKDAAYMLRKYGFYYLQLGKFKKGAGYYQQIVDLGRGSSEDKHFLGLAYNRFGDYIKAAKYLNQVIDLPRTDKTDVLFDATIEMANLMFAQNKPDDGKALYNEAILDRPANGQVRMRFAEALSKAMLEAEAIVQYKEVAKAYPKAWEVYQKMGVAQLKIDRKAESITSLNKAIELNPNSRDSYFFRGQAYAINNEHIKAVRDFEKSIEMDDNKELTTAHKYLATSYEASNNLAQACALWKQLAPYDENAKQKLSASCNK